MSFHVTVFYLQAILHWVWSSKNLSNVLKNSWKRLLILGFYLLSVCFCLFIRFKCLAVNSILHFCFIIAVLSWVLGDERWYSGFDKSLVTWKLFWNHSKFFYNEDLFAELIFNGPFLCSFWLEIQNITLVNYFPLRHFQEFVNPERLKKQLDASLS